MWGTILSLAGTAASLYGSYTASQNASAAGDANAAAIRETAAHNAAISRYDALVSYKEAENAYFRTNMEVSQHRQVADAFLSTQRTRYGKSGVSVGTGTPVETMARTYDEFMKDEMVIRSEGLKAIEASTSLAKRYENLAEYGLRDAAAQASLSIRQGQDRSTAFLLQGAATTASKVYDLGYNQGWWN